MSHNAPATPGINLFRGLAQAALSPGADLSVQVQFLRSCEIRAMEHIPDKERTMELAQLVFDVAIDIAASDHQSSKDILLHHPLYFIECQFGIEVLHELIERTNGEWTFWAEGNSYSVRRTSSLMAKAG